MGVSEQALSNFPALNFGEKEEEKEIDALVLRCLLHLENSFVNLKTKSSLD